MSEPFSGISTIVAPMPPAPALARALAAEAIDGGLIRRTQGGRGHAMAAKRVGPAPPGAAASMKPFGER